MLVQNIPSQKVIFIALATAVVFGPTPYLLSFGFLSREDQWKRELLEASLCYQPSNQRDSLRHLERALRISENLKAVNKIQTLNQIAVVQESSKDYCAAVQSIEKVIQLNESSQESHQQLMSDALRLYSELYEGKKWRAKVLKKYERWYASSREKFGDSHPSVIQSLLDLSRIYYKESMFCERAKLFEDWARIAKAYYGENSKEYAESLSNLAYSYLDSGQQVKAKLVEEKVLNIYRRLEAKGESVQDETGWSLVHLGKISLRVGEFKKAEEYFDNYFRIWKKIGDESSRKFVYTKNMGLLKVAQKDFEAATLYFEESLEALSFSERQAFEKGYEYSELSAGLALCHEWKGDFKTAAILINRAVAVEQAKRVPEKLPLFLSYKRDQKRINAKVEGI